MSQQQCISAERLFNHHEWLNFSIEFYSNINYRSVKTLLNGDLVVMNGIT